MKKLSIYLLFTLFILTITGCDFLETILEDPTYIVTFMDGDTVLETKTIGDYQAVDYNEAFIPEKEGYVFDGWYMDRTYNNPYTPYFNYKKDLRLYAKWSILMFDVSVLNTTDGNTAIYSLAYGENLSSIDIHVEGPILVGFINTDNNQTLAVSTVVTTNLNLKTVFETNEGYHFVQFVYEDTLLFSEVVLKNNELTLPDIPQMDDYLFMGWYVDSDYDLLYDFDNLVDQDLTLYAKFIKSDAYMYDIGQSSLSWTPYVYAQSYFIKILYEDEIVTIEAFSEATTDLRDYENILKDGVTLHIYANLTNNDELKLFEVTLQFVYTNAFYEEDFEADDFPARTHYSNNINPRIDGPVGFEYAILNGSASLTTPIEGLKTVQLRYNNNNIPYLESTFYLDNIGMIEVLIKNENQGVLLELLNADDVVLKYFEIDTSSKPITLTLTANLTEAARLRFKVVPLVDGSESLPVYIDDIKIYQTGQVTELVEIEPVFTPDPDLEAIMALFAEDRAKLTPPGFNALSEDGILQYYASLNGLSGEAFRTELTQILTSTHRRLISYNEARFVLEQSDLVTVGDKRYLDGIYSGHEIIPYWDGGATWAREHVWPNSRLAMDRVTASGRNQGSDVHNLRAINPSVNSSRSNRYFDQGTTFGLVGTEAYYPGDTYKGDVARILFYMLARYPDILTLRDDNIVDSAYTKEGAVMGILSLLLTWHEQDPVSDFERHRNEVIYTYQGNRNPFIDNPEYVDVYFN